MDDACGWGRDERSSRRRRVSSKVYAAEFWPTKLTRRVLAEIAAAAALVSFQKFQTNRTTFTLISCHSSCKDGRIGENPAFCKILLFGGNYFAMSVASRYHRAAGLLYPDSTASTGSCPTCGSFFVCAADSSISQAGFGRQSPLFTCCQYDCGGSRAVVSGRWRRWHCRVLTAAQSEQPRFPLLFTDLTQLVRTAHPILPTHSRLAVPLVAPPPCTLPQRLSRKGRR